MWYCAMQVASYVGDETCGCGSEGKGEDILDRERRGEGDRMGEAVLFLWWYI